MHRKEQGVLVFRDATFVMDLVREYHLEHKNQPHETLKQLYEANLYPGINSWKIAEYQSQITGSREIRWESRGASDFDGITIEKYSRNHSRSRELPLLYIHKNSGSQRPVMLWFGTNGKATSKD